ncbi:MAG: hypothetical protein U0694_25330 [Anaerolineae bacterium]
MIAVLVDTPIHGTPHDTAYGLSAPIATQTIGGQDVLLCAPTFADPRAAVRALKDLGATHLWLCEAVASLSPLLDNGDWLVPDDYIDGTRGQHYTYFSEKAGGYVQQVPPFDSDSRDALIRAAQGVAARTFKRAVYVCVTVHGWKRPPRPHSGHGQARTSPGATSAPYPTLARELEMKVAALVGQPQRAVNPQGTRWI